jgi:GT2 family glycosyltransferase
MLYPGPDPSMSPSTVLVVVPRERFSGSLATLRALRQHTPEPHRLIWIDAGSPPGVARRLRAELSESEYLRIPGYLTPNQARNRGLLEVGDARYVVYVDNDALVHPGWLGALLECAEETGAWAVGPLYLEGKDGGIRIHLAQGRTHLRVEPGARVFEAVNTHQGRKVEEVDLPRTPVEVDYVEFHCICLRRDALQRAGGCDEGLSGTREHLDLCLTLKKLGGTIYFQPRAVVTFPEVDVTWSSQGGRGRSAVHRLARAARQSVSVPFRRRRGLSRSLEILKLGLAW